MNHVETKVLTKSDWKTYKELRLASLQDSPDSFGSTYERESEFTDEEWASRLDLSDHATFALPLVAVLEGEPVGLAWGRSRRADDQVADVFQMWVSPSARGLGVGKLLLSRIIEWAGVSGFKVLSLGVTTVNVEAENLYKALGFQATGQLEALREGSLLSSQTMELKLSGGDK